jgi:hypothetical protein
MSKKNSDHKQSTQPQKKKKVEKIPLQIVPKKSNIIEYSKHPTPKSQITSIHIYDLFGKIHF